MAATIASRVAARRSSGASSQAREIAGQLAHGAGPDLEGEPAARGLRGGGAERAGDLGEPRVRSHHRQCAAGRGLGGDHAERLRERARHRHRLGRRQHVGQLGVVEPARPGDPVGHAAGRRAVAVRILQRVEEGGQVRQLGAVLAAQGPRRLEVAALEVRARAARARPGRPRSRRPAAARAARARAPAARRPAAARRPWRRSACRRRPRAGRRARWWPARPPPRRASARRTTRPRGRCSQRRPAARAGARARPGPRPGSRGVKRSTSTPGGPSRVRSSHRGVVHLGPQARAGVVRADEDPARARQALLRVRA